MQADAHCREGLFGISDGCSGIVLGKRVAHSCRRPGQARYRLFKVACHVARLTEFLRALETPVSDDGLAAGRRLQ